MSPILTSPPPQPTDSIFTTEGEPATISTDINMLLDALDLADIPFGVDDDYYSPYYYDDDDSHSYWYVSPFINHPKCTDSATDISQDSPLLRSSRPPAYNNMIVVYSSSSFSFRTSPGSV